MPKNFVRVFQRKAQGKDFPKIGTPTSVQPGDYLTFFLNGAYHTREVGSVHQGYVMTLPLLTFFGQDRHVLDDARKVLWEDMDSSDRRCVPVDPALAPTTPDPEPEPEPEPTKKPARQRKPRATPAKPPPPAPPPEPIKSPPKPKVKAAKPPKATVAEALDLWTLLDDDD